MMRIGPHALSSNLFLSPLAGYTNLPMRLTLRELGGLGWATTDLVNARSLLERNRTALQLVASSPEDRPLAIQLFGSVPEEMRDAAVMCEGLGVQAVDINMGCPVKKVVRIGGGSAMMTELDKTAALVRGMIAAVKIPITAKMRLGWDDQNLTAPDLARVLEDAGVAAIFVHGRTRAQGFSGTVNLAGIRAVAAAVKNIPVIGNGDITTPAAAKHMIDETGCAGVSVGRGAFYETAGCLRDVIQNHLFQVVALLAMEPPVSRSYGSVQAEKAKVFQAIRPLRRGDIVRGQYAGYRLEPNVDRNSDVETFCAARLQIDSWRWDGVPWYLRSGKFLPETAAEVMVEFKPPPSHLFADASPRIGPANCRLLKYESGRNLN